jgi:hypothetical protein
LIYRSSDELRWWIGVCFEVEWLGEGANGREERLPEGVLKFISAGVGSV